MATTAALDPNQIFRRPTAVWPTFSIFSPAVSGSASERAAPTDYSTMSAFVLLMKPNTSARSAAGTSKVSRVVSRWPIKRCQSLSARGLGLSGTSTHLTRQLSGTHYGAVRPSPAHRYFRPRGWSRLRLFPWHRRSGSHVPYKSLVELRAVYMPDAARAVSGHPPS